MYGSYILLMYWNMAFSSDVDDLRACRFKSSHFINDTLAALGRLHASQNQEKFIYTSWQVARCQSLNKIFSPVSTSSDQITLALISMRYDGRLPVHKEYITWNTSRTRTYINWNTQCDVFARLSLIARTSLHISTGNR